MDDAGWQALLAGAGHPPPLLITNQGARYLELPTQLMLGTGLAQQRASTPQRVPPASTMLLYTDGVIERRDRDLDDGLAALHAAAVRLSAAPVDDLCDELLAELVPHPSDDVCLLAVHTPGS